MINKFNFFFRNLKRDLKKSIAFSGKSCLLNKQKNYSSYKSLVEADFKIFSQNGEDGIIDFLLDKLKIENPKFVEIGVEDYEEANTRFLYETRNCNGLIIDNFINLKKLEKNLDLWKGNLVAIKETVNSNNINIILEKNNFHKNIDLFSIDIDGIDYWVIDKLPEKISKIFVAEYNPLYGPNLEITVPNLDNFNRTKQHYSNLYWGMSLKALVNLMIKKKFIFVGVNALKNNAFFVNEDYKNFVHEIIESVKFQKLEDFTNHQFMESRDKSGALNYLSKQKQIQEIYECSVINLAEDVNKQVKIVNLFDK